MKSNQFAHVSAQMPLPSITQLQQRFAADSFVQQHIEQARGQIKNIFNRQDDRLLVVVGPCSIHDRKAALEYAQNLVSVAKNYDQQLQLVMRCYFEKPRTTVGWKGLVFDPYLDGTDELETGIALAREILLEINQLGIATATEFLDLTSFCYLADLVSWGAIGARTTESQWHRQMASALPLPVGFKNSTDGKLSIAIDAMQSAMSSHTFASVNADNQLCVQNSLGNDTCHVILRGGRSPNYYPQDVEQAVATLNQRQMNTSLMIDCSHGNSRKQHYNQLKVVKSIEQQLALGQSDIVAVMAESFLQGGKQSLVAGQPLTYGQSITDACLSWHDTIALLDTLAEGVEARRNMVQLQQYLLA